MLQLLPDAEDEFITALENKIQAIRPMTELMMGGMDLKRLQLLPDAEDEFITALENKIQAIRPMTELMMGGMDLKRILKLLYEDMNSEDNEKLVENYEILEEKEVSYKCDCNKDKFYKGLITLGKDELNKIFAEEVQWT